jgi:hypothetical protein
MTGRSERGIVAGLVTIAVLLLVGAMLIVLLIVKLGGWC